MRVYALFVVPIQPEECGVGLEFQQRREALPQSFDAQLVVTKGLEQLSQFVLSLNAQHSIILSKLKLILFCNLK